MAIKVLIADDHHVVRRGLVFFLKTQPEIEIIGEAKNGREAVEMMQTNQPDVVLMDLDMPVMNGIEATRQIKASCPEVKIMILTSFSDQDHVIPAIEAGASGYQLKDIEPDILVQAIIQLMKGENQLHPKATSHLLTHLTNKNSTERQPLEELTKRELEVLREIAKGKSNKEIASSLYITEKTVKTHVSNLLSKLELADRTQAALYAVRHGIAESN
ncbi:MULTISPECIES: response regulator transcription factor [Cytobacillus]|jgi:DNA-binding NarL/FixJ family response regulator|uniref:DNA-binding response regulator n=2 Tax=Cytobacillus TaxID=2675230 RepID=A0A169FHN5_9BACI|nr:MULTISPECIES: response regulator transcription factor [Cytobacillus]MBY0159949.1 response regulator transcription factor [Cytobacillus firmus]AND38781.1 DNA-binding response regulator [Cytobacillus oceanisediminis 2691]MBU8732679.1 response regulator transcription factor [Cytobacillus oceanisediminis]MBU8767955.1 response regulator transcription factor [Cytobacillus oceanisediminis]MCM3392226.1 response regulator transcription factor [Cytobacillus oceanisediminis]